MKTLYFDRRLLGSQPGTTTMRTALMNVVREDPNDTIVIHHYVDVPGRLQVEVELRGQRFENGCAFKRYIFTT